MKKILWIEDEIDTYSNCSYKIANSYDLTHVKSYKEASKAIDVGSYNLYIVDMIIPGGETPTSLDELIQQSTHKYYGIDLLEKIVKKNKDSKIIVFSIASDKDTHEKIVSIDPGIVRLWKYEVNAEQLSSEVDSLMKQK